MIAPWLLYASAMGCLIVLVALLLEHIARWHNWPARWIWLAAIAGIVALPIALNLTVRSPAVPHIVSSVAPSRSAANPSLDMPLVLLWLAGSLLLAARIAGSALALHRRRAKWTALDVGTDRVLVSDQLGPAVIGWTTLTTVIPRWAFTLDERSRALMLQHEAEHARAGDPHFRTLALAALVAMPWNPALWWSLRRLRLAVEIDCDRRLIARGVDARQYATLLLAVGERISATPFAWATALAGSPSSLETRILAMTSSLRPRHYRLAIGGVSVIAVGLIAIACASPVPESVMPPAAPAGAVAKAAIVTRDSEIPTRVEAHVCELGSPCPGGPENMVVFRKTLRDGCEPGTECRREAEKAIVGDSIRRTGDTVYYYRGAKSKAHDLDSQLVAQQLILHRDEQAVTMSVNGRPITLKPMQEPRLRP